jgi:hypothetical protein
MTFGTLCLASDRGMSIAYRTLLHARSWLHVFVHGTIELTSIFRQGLACSPASDTTTPWSQFGPHLLTTIGFFAFIHGLP